MPRRRDNTGLVPNEVRILELLVRLAREESPSDLTKADVYGYSVSLALDEQASALGERPISNATVYRCLRRLEDFGALTSEWESDEAALADRREGRKRRYYRVTPLALPRLEEEWRMLEQRDLRPAWFRLTPPLAG